MIKDNWKINDNVINKMTTRTMNPVYGNTKIATTETIFLEIRKKL